MLAKSSLCLILAVRVSWSLNVATSCWTPHLQLHDRLKDKVGSRMQAFFISHCHFKTYILPKRWLLLVCDAVCTGNCVPTYRAAKYKAPLKRRKFKPLLRIFICHDDSSRAISWNVGTVLSDYRASHFVRPQNFVATSSITPDLTKLYVRCWHLSK